MTPAATPARPTPNATSEIVANVLASLEAFTPALVGQLPSGSVQSLFAVAFLASVIAPNTPPVARPATPMLPTTKPRVLWPPARGASSSVGGCPGGGAGAVDGGSVSAGPGAAADGAAAAAA